MATTKWQSIDEDYRSWLARYPISEEEFDIFDFERRKNLRQEYRGEQQQQQQWFFQVKGTINSLSVCC